MSEAQIISWIFLSIALASEVEPAEFKAISMIADGINHAVPTHKELQSSITWLTVNGLVNKSTKKYVLTTEGKMEYNKASKETEGIYIIWANLETRIMNYA